MWPIARKPRKAGAGPLPRREFQSISERPLSRGQTYRFGHKTGDKEPTVAMRKLRRLVATLPPAQARERPFRIGRLHAGSAAIPCAIGSSLIARDKREGDHATPAGAFRLLFGFYRPDRVARHATLLPMRPIRRGDGWCDDPKSALYNRLVALPCRPSHEKLWRADRLYDVLIVLDYNIQPRRKARGSAIFLHCARPDLAPTEGCVALRPEDLRRLLPRLSPETILFVR